MYFMYNFCNDYMRPIANLIKIVIDFIKFGIPIVLVIFGMIDLGKAVMAGKEDEMKKAQGTLIKRFLYAVVAFLVVTLVTFAMGLVGSDSWKECWKGHGKANVSDIES